MSCVVVEKSWETRLWNSVRFLIELVIENSIDAIRLKNFNKSSCILV